MGQNLTTNARVLHLLGVSRTDATQQIAKMETYCPFNVSNDLVQRHITVEYVGDMYLHSMHSKHFSFSSTVNAVMNALGVY